MGIKYAFGGIALALCATSFGAIVEQNQSAGVLDNQAAVLAGVHSTTESGFIDIFAFSVTGPGVALAEFSETAFTNDNVSFTFNTVLLADSSNVALAGSFAIDTDGSDGWEVFASLPGAGTYHVITGGAITGGPATGAPGVGYYLGAVGTQVTAAVPEPESYGLMMLGLGAIGWVCRRKSAA